MDPVTEVLGGIKRKVSKKVKRSRSKAISRARKSSLVRKLSMKRSGTYNAKGRKIKRSTRSKKTSYTVRANGDIVKHDSKLGRSYFVRKH